MFQLVPKKILLLTLGGTIACVKTRKGLVPKLKAVDLISAVSLPAAVEVEGEDFLKRTIVFPEDWVALSREIFNRFEHYDGFVVTLGTDTMAYVAAALSLMLHNLSKPVVLTGAMNSISTQKSDGKSNLYNTILTAAQSGIGGVFVVFNGKIFEGNHVSKVRSEGIDAFEGVNIPPAGIISKNKIHWHKRFTHNKRKLVLKPVIDTRVVVVKLTPNIRPEFFNGLGEYKGIIIEGYGDGNVSVNLVPALKHLTGKQIVILASQCLYGKVSHKYEGGMALMRNGAISAGNMTQEMILVKLMWALGQNTKLEETRRILKN